MTKKKLIPVLAVLIIAAVVIVILFGWPGVLRKASGSGGNEEVGVTEVSSYEGDMSEPDGSSDASVTEKEPSVTGAAETPAEQKASVATSPEPASDQKTSMSTPSEPASGQDPDDIEAIDPGTETSTEPSPSGDNYAQVEENETSMMTDF